MRHHSLFIGSITLILTACGGSASQEGPRAPGGSPAVSAKYGQQPYSASATSAEGGDQWFDGAPSDQAAPAPSADRDFEAEEAPASGAARSDSQVAPERNRPGLATVWGETRTSRITTSPFTREDPDSPAAVAKLFYNDEDGARTMARRRGFVNVDDGVFSLAGGALTVSLRDSNGNPFRAFHAGNQNFVVGDSGERYVIHLANHTGVRLEAVATVDGLDVIDGRPGMPTKRGYILNPFSTVEIDGFRQSTSAVAAFRFGAVEDSYAEKKGNGRNVGVIGVAFFQERDARWPRDQSEIDRRESADPFPGRFATPPMR